MDDAAEAHRPRHRALRRRGAGQPRAPGSRSASRTSPRRSRGSPDSAGAWSGTRRCPTASRAAAWTPPAPRPTSASGRPRPSTRGCAGRSSGTETPPRPPRRTSRPSSRPSAPRREVSPVQASPALRPRDRGGLRPARRGRGHPDPRAPRDHRRATSLALTEPDLNRVALYDVAGPRPRKIGAFGRLGFRPGELHGPHGATARRRGRLYVADTFNHRIQLFDIAGLAEGRAPRLVRAFGNFGTAIGDLRAPHAAVALSAHRPRCATASS